MKISKRVECSDTATMTKEENSKYEEAQKLIRSAIDSLSKIAKDDKLARESIANLSVVLLDLKSEK